MALEFVLNGQVKSIPGLEAGASLTRVIEALGLRGDRVAVEVNGEIMRREGWASSAIQNGDRMELVHFVGGG